jgi:hypothetical protein
MRALLVAGGGDDGMVQDNELGERGMRSMVSLEQGESPLLSWLET